MNSTPILPRQRIRQLALLLMAFGCTGLFTPAALSAGLPGALPAAASPAGAPPAVASPAAAVPAVALPTASPAAALPAAAAEEPRFTWPLHPRPQLVRGFDAPETDFGPGHRGVDLAATADQQVLSAGTGYVVFAGTIAGRGVVSVDHDGGLRTTYEPLTPQVAAGDQVYAGQVIGTVTAGHPECAVAVCLHWGVRRGLEYLDPLPLVQETTRLRLKPWDSG